MVRFLFLCVCVSGRQMTIPSLILLFSISLLAPISTVVLADDVCQGVVQTKTIDAGAGSSVSCNLDTSNTGLIIEKFQVQSSQGDKLRVGITYGEQCQERKEFLDHSCVGENVSSCGASELNLLVPSTNLPACLVIFCYNLIESCQVSYSFMVKAASSPPISISIPITDKYM